jgi:predicted amidophosphoribosyltransferase
MGAEEKCAAIVNLGAYRAGRACPFCSSPLAAPPAACPACGRDPAATRRFCRLCRAARPSGERVCWNCGARAGGGWRLALAILLSLLSLAAAALALR